MARNDELGAIAAATYFITELYPYTLNSLDTGPWRAMSDGSCRYCESMATAVESMRDAGKSADIAQPAAGEPDAELVEPGLYYTAFELSTGPNYYYSNDGTLSAEYPITSGRAELNVLRDGDRWVIAGCNLVADNPDAA